MVRKDKDIKGILINNKEFKLSQYADDTQIFLDGTEITLRKTLEKLNTFYLMSGLKLNIDKTQYGLDLWISQIVDYVRNINWIGIRKLLKY